MYTQIHTDIHTQNKCTNADKFLRKKPLKNRYMEIYQEQKDRQNITQIEENKNMFIGTHTHLSRNKDVKK